ncbi:GNAT family N-acetyltransferase [Reinekea blandensis]|uniref:Aminoglycoside N(6')-acetyltransferase type 1 n=1 Tax=Reinekea blandensis MED297 TaxID=314283 RepID=A4BCD2_9GAMM|nr:GNAT family N-acetyltransferase [Reinekea blandensis]EAR10198.1 Histone acetyltransferase HPA2/related acetyltransferase [Reinekea sp. MED297] [Reinekea blandensis MED297]
MNIRTMTLKDREVWAEMRSSLWPEFDEDHTPELDKYFAGQSRDVTEAFIAEVDGQAAGFIELNIRNYAEGSHEPAVPYVEAWYVASEFRGQGLGKQLMARAEQWALERGYIELASDTDEWNAYSIEQHTKLGFKETGRVVCFLKTLTKKP